MTFLLPHFTIFTRVFVDTAEQRNRNVLTQLTQLPNFWQHMCDKVLLFQEFKKHIKFIISIKNKTSIVTCETKYVESKKALENVAKYFHQNNETFTDVKHCT